jgi:uncharacterized phage protein (TIGR02220 family)
VKAIAKEEDRTVASALRCLVRRQLQVVKLLENGAIRLESAPICVESAENPQSPEPASPTPPDPDPEEEKRREDLEKKEDRRGSVRGNLDFRQVAEHVISEMNRIASRSWTAKAWEPNVSKLLAKGFTQDDLMIVVDWKAAECKRSGDWQWFKPDTLFKPTLFAGKLDNARAGVEHSPQKTLAFTDGEKRAERWDKRKESGYYGKT